jgi:hypothetical protein
MPGEQKASDTVSRTCADGSLAAPSLQRDRSSTSTRRAGDKGRCGGVSQRIGRVTVSFRQVGRRDELDSLLDRPY